MRRLSVWIIGGVGLGKRRVGEVIRHDLRMLGLVEDMTQDRKRWRARIKVIDF